MIAAIKGSDETTGTFAPPATADSTRLRQVVCFTVGGQTYGIGIEAVREIRAWTATTALPRAPDFVRGVVNLRGAIVPILDLRACFGQGQTEPNKAHVVIVIQIAERPVGMLVEAVSDIVKVPAESVKPVPDMSGSATRLCLDGLIAVNERMIPLVSAERILAPVAGHGTA